MSISLAKDFYTNKVKKCSENIQYIKKDEYFILCPSISKVYLFSPCPSVKIAKARSLRLFLG